MTICLAGVAGVCFAQDQHPIEAWFDQQSEKDPTTAGAIAAASDAAKKWDTELNKVYRDLRGILDPQAQGVLRDTQRAWIAYRDSEFALMTQIYEVKMALEGTIWRMSHAIARMELVGARVKDLTRYLNDVKSGEGGFEAEEGSNGVSAKEMASVLKELTNLLGLEDSNKVSASKNAWLAFRDTEVLLINNLYGEENGKIKRAVMGAERLKTLQGYVNDINETSDETEELGASEE